MKKKCLRGVAAFLAVVMMMPVSAFATTGGTEDPAGGGEPPIATVSEVPTFEISISDELYNTGTNTEATL
ncbi:MAG: hypothetical protein IJV76_11170, partial [Clostridia bacterium]|nr:hypothetical protein [Clostridia bacterium]